jgi:hypothetical protein
VTGTRGSPAALRRRAQGRLGAAAFVAVASITLAACGSSSSSSAPQLDQTVLAPATVAPVVHECHQTVTKTQDGNAMPLICDAGGLNVDAWNFYAKLGTSVMSIGRTSTVARLIAAMCNDVIVNHATSSQEVSAAALASYYYAWGLLNTIGTFQASTCEAAPAA